MDKLEKISQVHKFMNFAGEQVTKEVGKHVPFSLGEDGKFYFWSDVGSEPFGPYESLEEAKSAYIDYFKMFL